MVRAIIGVLILGSTADAQLFGRRTHVKIIRQIVQVPVAVPIQTLFLVAPPSYYGTPQYTPPEEARRRGGGYQEIVDTLSRVVSTLVALEGRITALEERPAPEPPEPDEPPPPPLPPVRIPTIVAELCGKCHSGDDIKGDFRLSDLANPNKLLLSLALVANDKMPLDADGNPVELAPHVRHELQAALKKMEEK